MKFKSFSDTLFNAREIFPYFHLQFQEPFPFDLILCGQEPDVSWHKALFVGLVTQFPLNRACMN